MPAKLQEEGSRRERSERRASWDSVQRELETSLECGWWREGPERAAERTRSFELERNLFLSSFLPTPHLLPSPSPSSSLLPSSFDTTVHAHPESDLGSSLETHLRLSLSSSCRRFSWEDPSKEESKHVELTAFPSFLPLPPFPPSSSPPSYHLLLPPPHIRKRPHHLSDRSRWETA